MTRQGLVIFDIDGTLFDGRAATLPAVARAFKELGLAAPDPVQIQSFIGKTSDAFHSWLGTLVPAGRSTVLAAAVERYELDFVANGAQVYPGVPDALRQLKGFARQLAICTNGPQPYVSHVLSVHDLRPFFDRVRYPRSGADSKPRMVRELLEALSARPAVVVGDRGDDVQAAHENGLPAIACTYGYGTPQELAAADAAADSPAALPDLIRALFDR